LELVILQNLGQFSPTSLEIQKGDVSNAFIN